WIGSGGPKRQFGFTTQDPGATVPWHVPPPALHGLVASLSVTHPLPAFDPPAHCLGPVFGQSLSVVQAVRVGHMERSFTQALPGRAPFGRVSGEAWAGVVAWSTSSPPQLLVMFVTLAEPLGTIPPGTIELPPPM